MGNKLSFNAVSHYNDEILYNAGFRYTSILTQFFKQHSCSRSRKFSLRVSADSNIVGSKIESIVELLLDNIREITNDGSCNVYLCWGIINFDTQIYYNCLGPLETDYNGTIAIDAMHEGTHKKLY